MEDTIDRLNLQCVAAVVVERPGRKERPGSGLSHSSIRALEGEPWFAGGTSRAEEGPSWPSRYPGKARGHVLRLQRLEWLS